MRRTWGSFGMLAVLLAALAGCEPTLRQKLRPPKQPEAYNLPPADDTRYTDPIAFPKNTLNQDSTKIAKDAKDAASGAPAGAGGPGGSPRMGGGMGGMGGGQGGP